MTVRTILDIFRTTIKEFTDDTIYDDEYLWNLFKISRNKLISQKYKNINKYCKNKPFTVKLD